MNNMNDREKLQKELESLDMQIAKLLAERMAITDQLASSRLDRSLTLSDETRDAELLSLAEQVGGEYGGYVKDICRTIIRSAQKQQAKHFGIEMPYVIDITRELLSSDVYPGDPVPQLTRVGSIAEGRNSNLSALSMCVHNSTHMDAPLHFIDGAGDILSIPPEVTVGVCLVADYDHDVTAEDISALPDGTQRLLVRGNVFITPDGAKAAAEKGLLLIGVEPQSVAPAETSCEVHRTLLGGNVILLEGLDLTQVCTGEYILLSAPLKIAGSEGAPCRAMLMYI